MFAGEEACSRGKLWQAQFASTLNQVSTLEIADVRQVSVLPMRFGMKRKIFSGGNEGDANLITVPLMPLTLTEPVTPFDCRLVFIAIAFDSKGLIFVISNALGTDPSIGDGEISQG